MNKKFIRTMSPVTAGVIALLDIAVIIFGVLSVRFLRITSGARPILFAALEVFAIIIAVLVTKEILSCGIIFREDELEFTAVDENNIFSYDEIERVEIYKDNAASLTKNFNDRHALITFEKKDGSSYPIDAGLIDVKTVKNIKSELEKHIDGKKIELRIINKGKLIGNASDDKQKPQSGEKTE